MTGISRTTQRTTGVKDANGDLADVVLCAVVDADAIAGPGTKLPVQGGAPGCDNRGFCGVECDDVLTEPHVCRRTTRARHRLMSRGDGRIGCPLERLRLAERVGVP